MPAIPLGIGAYRRADAFQPEVELENLYLEEDKSGGSPDQFMRLQRPGLVEWGMLGASADALLSEQGVFDGAVFAVAAARLWQVGAGTVTELGNLAPGRANLVAAKGVVAALAGGDVWRWDGSALSALPLPDDEPAADICQINGYLVIVTPRGRVYWLVPGATSIDPLDFATAESAPDGLVGCESLGSEIYLFGHRTIEPWQPTGDADAPFMPAMGRIMQRGCLAADTIARFDNSLLWVGDDRVLYRADAVPQRVSDHGIEERLRKATALPAASVFQSNGHLFYVLDIPGEGSFALDAATRQWSRFTSPGSEMWRAQHHIDGVPGRLAADRSTGVLWRLAEGVSRDGETVFVRRATGIVPFQTLPPRNDSLSLGIGAAADTEVVIEWRDADEAWPTQAEAFPVRAGSDVVSVYRLGRPHQPYRIVRITSATDVAVRYSGMVANEAWQ